MLNRPAAHAESQDLSRGLQTKATRRPWNPALHPRDARGRFIETGGIAKLWSGQLARVVRALPHDRVLVQDRVSDGTYTGRRHTTSAKWITMVARPDGTAPTDNEDKVAAEDARRHDDPKRGNGIALDDPGDPTTPDEPHDVDDRGNPIGDDQDGDGPDDDDDQDEPEDGAHPVNLDALPNRPNVRGSRYLDTAAVRRHFLDLAAQPDQNPKMAAFLRNLAVDETLQLTPSGKYAILRDTDTGRLNLTATGTGQRIDAAGSFDTVHDAGRFAVHLDNTARNGHVMPGKFNEPFDFSDPNLDKEARDWRSTKGENIQSAIVRARKEFDATPAPAPAKKTAAAQPTAAAGGRFKTLQDVRAHWADLHDRLENEQNPKAQKAAQGLDELLRLARIKLAGDGQFVIRQNSLGGWELVSTGRGTTLSWTFDRQRDAQDFAAKFAAKFAGTVTGQDGKPLDLSDPDVRLAEWRSDEGLTLHQVWTRARAQWDREHFGHDRSPAQQRLAEVMRGTGQSQETAQPTAPETPPAPAPDPAPEAQAPVAPSVSPAKADEPGTSTAANLRLGDLIDEGSFQLEVIELSRNDNGVVTVQAARTDNGEQERFAAKPATRYTRTPVDERPPAELHESLRRPHDQRQMVALMERLTVLREALLQAFADDQDQPEVARAAAALDGLQQLLGDKAQGSIAERVGKVAARLDEAAPAMDQLWRGMDDKERSEPSGMAVRKLLDLLDLERGRVRADEERLNQRSAATAQPTPQAAPVDEQPEPAVPSLPDDAQPVDDVEGYHYTNDGGALTVYGPDGQVAVTAERGYPPKATVNGVQIPVPQYPKSGAVVMARAHRAAQMPPEQRDVITAEWTTFKGKRVMVFRGTIKNNDRDYNAVGSVRAIKWAPSLEGWVTQSNMLPATRDERIAEVLGNLGRQGRYVLISDEQAAPAGTPRTSEAPARALDPDEEFRNHLRNAPDERLRFLETERWSKQSRVRRESGRRQLQRELNMISEERKRRQQERDEAILRDPTSLSDQDVEAQVGRSQDERGSYGSRRGEEANEVERAVYGERRRRSRAVAEDSTELSSMSEEDIDKARKLADDRNRLHQAAGDDPEAERSIREALQARSDALRAEIERRRAGTVATRKPVADVTDEELEDEYSELLMRRGRRTLDPEVRSVFDGRMKDVKEERKRRQIAEFTDRPDPVSTDSAELTLEYAELEKGRTSYEDDAVSAARKERLAAIAAELDQRDTEANQAFLSRVDSLEGNTVTVDGGNPYATVDYSAHGLGGQVGWFYRRYAEHSGSQGRGFPSRVAAIAAAVQAYDNDDSRQGERTWGREHRVFVPKMFFELYKGRRLRDRLASATPERRHLFEMFKGSYGWDEGTNPVTGKHVKGRSLVIPQGLLAEFHRVIEELSREMMEESTNRELDSSDRQRAKIRLAAINAALHAVEAAREQVRQDGGDDDQKVISREEIEAQQAALRAALGGNDDDNVQPHGAGALAEVPAAGVGGDGGPGGVRSGEGPGDRGSDSGGRGGAGTDGAAGNGVPGAGGSAQAGQGGRDSDGDAGTAAGAGGRGGAGTAQPGDGGADGAQGRDVRSVERFRPDPAEAPKGPIGRAAANLDAIRSLKRIEEEQRPPTDWERRAMARWSGWGSVPVLFATKPDEKAPRYQQGGTRHGKFEADYQRWAEYTELRSAIREVLTPLEWRRASRGVLSMHYTPQPIAEAMWDGLRAFGFERGDVLEAGSGAGTFFGVAPDGARLTGVELDPTSARIAQVLYPDANVLNESFAETDAHPGTFDAAIGNVPFASIPFTDKRYPAESLHNGFITKELALVRPGGITAVITSRHTLDSKGDKARRQMAKYGDLIGAVRLPAGVFKDAGTGVTTDVLVFRRREDGEEPGDASWLDAPERDINGTTERVNSYFAEHPEHILGELTTESSQYGPRLTVKGDPAKAAEQLREALQKIAAQATADGRGYQSHPDGDDRPPVQLQTAREKHANDWTGRLYEGDDGQFYQHVNGGEPVLVEPSNDGGAAQLRALMGLRDVAAELRELDRKNDEDERAEKLRGQLGDLHAAYVTEYGPLSKPGQHRTKNGVPTAWGYFRADPDAAAVRALERWDAEKQEPVLSRIFAERAAARRREITSTDDPKAALAAVVAATGEVDLGQVSRLLNLDPQETLRRLGTEVYTDPATGRLELASTYLSGAVRDKLEAARKAAAKDPAYAVNVAALEGVQPADRTIGEFTPEMGAHWTPPELLQGFLREYLGDRTLNVSHDDRYGWVLTTGKIPEANNVLHGVPANEEKGTKGKPAVAIARAVLGYGSLTIYHDDKRKDVDEETSRLVRQKADRMRAEFAKYATANAERLTTLTDSFNRVMNGHVVRSYDGMSPTLEGFTPDRDPHPWQLAGAARMQFEPSVILAHEVGLGKTSTLVMGTQALKASGQIEKPFVVVPDHLAQQWSDEAQFLYPNADIHLITSADLADGQRASTLEWLRANKPDLVIFTEPAFGSIKMSPEAQEAYEFRELEALREQLDRQYAEADNPGHPFIVAKIEERIATVERNMGKNAAPMRTPGETYWDDLGFDYATIDEAHRYKGVGFRSKEGGGDPASIRGIDLHQKLTDLHARRQGRATVTLATGTPLSNSISEQFTILSFTAPWVLDAYRAGAPDLWAATFGRKTLRIENAPDGSGLRVVERFSEFHNKRAMKTMWGLVADTRRAEDVGIPRPKVKGNAPNLIMVDPTKDQTARLLKLVARGRAIHNGEVTRHEDNMLAVSNEGTSVALDPRLVDARAPAGNKLRAVADRHIERYHRLKDRTYKTSYGSDEEHPVPGALQMIFMNEGVPGGKNKGDFDAYAQLRDLMVAGGIPAEKIAFVQDHKKSGKPEDVAELFRRARDGEISVLIGSSSVAGTGMNAQNRMASLTHVDLDWGAAQMEQRNGRVLRYGNQNEEVEIDIFATKGSMDGWKAGFVAAKAEGLIDIQRPETADGDTSDTVTEIDGAEFDYETMEAEIGGNPYMSQLMKARRALRDLEIDQHNEAAERIRRAEALAALRQEADDIRAGITRREQALPRIRDVRDDFAMTLAGSPYSERADAAAALHRQVTTRLLEHDRQGMAPWHILGQYGGLDFGVRTERTDDGRLIAHVGFPDLARSEFTRTPDELRSKGVGAGMITRLGNALQKAPALQSADRANVPQLDQQIALLQSAHAAADFTPLIEYARQRSNLLEDIVGKVADLDKLPEIDPDELSKKLTQAQRRSVVAEREEKREPLKARIDAAVAKLAEFDRDNPAPEPDDQVRLTQEEVNDTLARIRPESEASVPEGDGLVVDSTGAGSGGDEPPAADPVNSGQDDGGEEQPEPVNGEQGDAADPDTVTLDSDDVSAQLDAVRPEGSKAPSSMTNEEISAEMVALMEREMADGELSGIDRTRMAVLEAEEGRRAGRAPKPQPKPRPAEPAGGLFDIDDNEYDTPAAVADPDNPLDRPADEFGTPDMFADAEGRDTSRLRPVQMRNAADLEDGDRYTDADGRTHTVAEKPVRTGRGRTRIVTDDGQERFYNADTEVRLRYPDEEIPENEEENNEPQSAGNSGEGGSDAPAEPEQTTTADPAPKAADRTDITDRADRMAGLVARALNIAGGDALPEIQELADAMDRAEAADDPEEELRDIARRLDSLADRYEVAGPRGERAAALYRRAARIARNEDEGEDTTQDDENQQNEENDDERQGPQDTSDAERRSRDADADAGAADPDETSPDGGAGTPGGPGVADQSGGGDSQNQPDQKDDGERRRRRRRRGETSPEGGGPGGPGAPLLGFPLGNGVPVVAGGTGDGGRDSGPQDSVDALRDAWKRGDRLTVGEDTPQRRAALAQFAERDGLVLSPGGGIVTWPEQQADGTTVWSFAQARNGARLPDLTLTTDDPEEARALAARFEEITGADRQPFDWHRPWGPSTVTQWRDNNGRNLRDALQAVRDDFEQQRSEGGQQAEPEAFTLPADLAGMDDEEIAAALRNRLTDEDLARLMEEMDSRDNPDQRIRDAVPDTPPENAEEAARRAAAMDAALAFNGEDVTRPAKTQEQRLQEEFVLVDEARYLAAEEYTRGHMVNNAGLAAGVSARQIFSAADLAWFGKWRQYASEDLVNWFDANGGRLTFNEYKKQQRANDRTAREQHEEETRQREEQNTPAPDAASDPELVANAANPSPDGSPSTPRFSSVDQIRDRIRNRELDAPSHPDMDPLEIPNDRRADNPTLELSSGGRLTIRDAQAESRFNTPEWLVAAPGSMETLYQTMNQRDAVAYARVLEEIRDAEGNPFPWDAPDAAERARAFRSPSGESLGEVIARHIVADAESGDLENWPDHQLEEAREQIARQRAMDAYYDAWRTQQEADGYTIPVDVQDTQIGDDVTALYPTTFDRPVTQRGRLDRDLRPRQLDRTGWWPFTIGANYGAHVEEGGTETDGDRVAPLGVGAYRPVSFINNPERPTAFRRPRPDEEQPGATQQPGARAQTPEPDAPAALDAATQSEATSDTPATPQTALGGIAEPELPEGEPEPIDGQPAHWARVGDLAAGDTARVEGTTQSGRKTTRAGFVLDTPEQVSVTRRNRTETMWRTTIGEHLDGRGRRGVVYTPLNATAARAEAPDDTTPGSPATGAQSDVRSGNLPDTVPTDGNGQGLFPGSTVTGPGDREGTVTGATDTTVSVRWSDGTTDIGVTPTSLTFNSGWRPDGWTAAGQRVRPGHIVTDENGALLGPVDEVDGDRVTVTTAGGTVSRSAGDLRIAGEVRDDAGAAEPVTGISDPAAGDLAEGDVVVLDFDGAPTTVQVMGISRDGDRVTLEYADTSTGEIGELELDASAIVPRAEGPDGAPQLGPEDSPESDDELTVHEPVPVVEPVTGPTVDPELTPADRNAINDHGSAPEDDPDAQQAAARIGADLPVTPDQAAALAAQLRASEDPSTAEGRAALRAADHLDQAADRTPPTDLDRPRPSNAAQLAEGDIVAMPDERRGDEVHVFRVLDVADAPGGVRRLLLEDEDQLMSHQLVAGGMPVWQLPEPRPEAPTPPDVDDSVPAPDPAPAAPDTTPEPPSMPVARVTPGSLRVGDVIDTPVSRTGYQFNGHRRLTITTPPRRNGWWMQLVGMDDDGNMHDVGLHSGREVNVYERNRPTPAIPPAGAPRDPNPSPLSAADQVVADHARTVATRIIDEAIAGTQSPGSIHALREQIGQRLTPEALREARQSARQEANEALDAAGVTGRDRARAQQALKQTRKDAHEETVRAVLRTINDLEPLPDESDEDLAQRAADLLRLIPSQVSAPTRTGTGGGGGDGDIVRAVAGHTDEAVAALLQQLQAAGLDAGDAEQVGRLLTGHLNGSRQATARRIARRVAATSPAVGRQPGMLARIVALLIRLGRRLIELVKAAVTKIGEKWSDARERLGRLRAFLGRLTTRVRQWPESRRLARLQAALDLPSADGESLAARVSHWAGLLPESGRFGQTSRRVTWWRPTTWAQLAAGRLPERSDRMRWAPDRAADGGPGLTALRHMAALRAAGGDVDQDVTRRLADALGDDFGGDPHGTLQHADDYVAATERRLANLQAARSSATIQDPDVDVEIAAARVAAGTARSEWESLRTRYAAAVPDAVAAALAEIRDIGSQGNAGLVFTPDSDPDAERAVRGVQRLIPRSWLSAPAGRRITAVDGDQGRYERESRRATIADLADDGLGTAGYALAQHFAQHVADLDAAQRVFWFTRTHTGRPGARRMSGSALGRLLSRQQTQPETGDSLARSVQSMFSGDWYQDDDLRAFLLGLLATR